MYIKESIRNREGDMTKPPPCRVAELKLAAPIIKTSQCLLSIYPIKKPLWRGGMRISGRKPTENIDYGHV